MRLPIVPCLLLSAIVMSASCGQPAPSPPAPVPAATPVPAAFEEGSALGSIAEIKSRGYDESAVDQLFEEVLEKDTALAGLLARWAARGPLYAEHANAFQVFHGNNVDYYADAEQKASGLADTTLERGITRRLGVSQERYQEVTAPFHRTMERHRKAMEEGSDLITLITLERTLDVVETYQRENLPDRKVLDNDLADLMALRDELRAKLKP